MKIFAASRIGFFALSAILGVSLSAPALNAATKATTAKANQKAKPTVKTTKAGAAKQAAARSSGLTAITVDSDTDHYYVLFVKPVAGNEWELPVAIARGTGPTTVLTDGRKQLASARYRVEKHLIAKPVDTDADGVDDITELDGAPALNPLSAVQEHNPNDAVAIVRDRASFEKLSYQGVDVGRDGYLAGLEYVKFYITKSDTSRPLVYVMNTETWRAHPMFAQAMGISSGRGRGTPGEMRGDVSYYPKAMGPDGTRGLYRFAFQPNDSYSFAEISVAFEAIANQMPFLAPKLAYYPIQNGLAFYEQEKQLYSGSRVPVVLEAQLVNE